MASMDDVWQKLQTPLLEYAGRILGAALLFILGWLAVRFLVGPLRRLLGRSRIDPTVASFLTNSARSAILVVVLLGVLQELGIQTASLLALVGAAGIAIALSLQGSLANFASGLVLLAFRMVRVGDWIELGDIRGRITEMLPFHIVLVTADNQRLTVPNSTLTSGPVRNHSALPTRRVQWTLPLTPQDDLAAVKQALTARLLADPRILKDEAPQVFVQDWLPDRRNLAIQCWTATSNCLTVQQELLEALGETLEGLRSAKPQAANAQAQ